jgi:very-long-chain ceramide synthase
LRIRLVGFPSANLFILGSPWLIVWLGLSFNLIALLCLVHWSMPRARVHTRRFFALSYYDSATGKYGVGWDDALFTFFFVILFTGLRAATMEYILAPLAKSQGISKRRVITRFSEQAWFVIYYSIFWTLGLVGRLISLPPRTQFKDYADRATSTCTTTHHTG